MITVADILQPHMIRVVTEREELLDKIKKLDAFTETPIYEKLNKIEKGHLRDQRDAMHAYARALGNRISMAAMSTLTPEIPACPQKLILSGHR